MFDTDDAHRLLIAGVVLLVGVGSCLAWISAGRRDPAGPAARAFMTIGLIMAALDFRGLGTVLGLSLAAMGALVAWEGQPEPEVPRPRRGGIVVAATLTGLATLAMFDGLGPLSAVPEEARAVATVAVAATGTLATLAVADRARITLRDALRRRFAPAPPPH